MVNNAGYGHFGFVEELTEAEARDQIETNVFGALWVTQAALPFLRAQGSGHIIQVSSIGGITAFPLVGIYHASKWALEGFSQSLAQEVAPFGIHVTLIEPGEFRHRLVRPVVHALEAPARLRRTSPADRRGRPSAGPSRVTPRRRRRHPQVVDAKTPPLRVFFGESPLQTARADYESRLATWEQWQPVPSKRKASYMACAST